MVILMSWVKSKGSCVDAITGERIFDGADVFDTGYRNKRVPFDNSKMKLVKEETIVWLAEQAGYALVKRDAGDSGDAEVVDGADVSVGGGAVKAGKAKAGGRKAAS